MDWSAFLKSDEFRTYRKRQAQAVADNIKFDINQLVSNGDFKLSAMAGKMEMIRALLRLPEALTEDKELKSLLSIQLDEDVANITKYLVRQSLND